MRLDDRIDKLLELWAKYRIGGRSVPVATYQRMRYSSGNGEPGEPPVFDAEIELGRLIALLPPTERTFISLMYPRSAVQTAMVVQALKLTEPSARRMLRVIHLELARMIEQRRRGEPIDPSATRARVHRAYPKIKGKRVAGAVKDVD